VIDTLGADILRLWVASVDYRGEIPLSQDILTRNVEAYRRIRNTARFLLANLHGFDPALHQVAPNDMLLLDHYIVQEAAQLQKDIIAAFDAYQFHVVIQKIQHFCVNELGGFYLDIIKDRQYTMPENSLGRRSAQTALFHIVQAFVRWLAPILSFTAEEIWLHLPIKQEESVFLTTWYQGFAEFETKKNTIDWSFIRIVRDEVNKEIEAERARGTLGSSLEAQIELYATPQIAFILSALHDELRFVLITSSAKVTAVDAPVSSLMQTSIPGLQLSVKKTDAAKCVRCWHRRDDVGEDSAHPELCSRCVTNITTDGEKRIYA
jgi:isoleucyl-tRNA synthetase